MKSTLTASRSYKAMTEVYSHFHGAHKTVICCFPLERITGTFAGIPKRAIRTASSQLSPTGRSKQNGTLTILVSSLRLLSTARSQFSRFRVPNLRQTASLAISHRLWTMMTSSTKRSHSPEARASTFKKRPNGYRGPAVRLLALAGRL